MNQRDPVDIVKRERDQLIDRINSLTVNKESGVMKKKYKHDKSHLKTEIYEPYLINYDYSLDKNLLLHKGARNHSSM